MDKILYSERPTSYIKGPDVMSKSERTRSRYTKSFKGRGQTRLELFLQSHRQISQRAMMSIEAVLNP